LGHISIDRFGISSERVTFPVLNVGWDFWDAIVEAQAANVTSIEISIDDVGENQILAIMRGWVGPFTIVTHGIWGIANFVLCIRACYLMHLGRNAATVTIALHGIASVCASKTTLMHHRILLIDFSKIVRLIYLIDPFCGWLFPIPFATMIFTMSIPFTLSGCLIITLYWFVKLYPLQHLTIALIKSTVGRNDMINDTSLSVISFLTTSRWLAGILIPLVVIVEAVTASLRGTVGNVGATVVSGCASETQSETLATTNRPWFHLANNRAVYAVVAILLIILYTWVSIRILRRLSKLARLASNQRLLHRVRIKALDFNNEPLLMFVSLQATIRMLLSGGGLLLSLIVSILFITPITHNSIADAMLRWGAYVALNFISTNHILVFERAVSKPRNRKSTIKTPSQSSRSASANTGQG
jgi:hypothetical protein